MSQFSFQFYLDLSPKTSLVDFVAAVSNPYIPYMLTASSTNIPLYVSSRISWIILQMTELDINFHYVTCEDLAKLWRVWTESCRFNRSDIQLI